MEASALSSFAEARDSLAVFLQVPKACQDKVRDTARTE
jgi:hypothetical protein